MSSSEPSIAGYLLYLHRRGLPRPSPPHPPTSEETLVLSLVLSAILASPAQSVRPSQRGDPQAKAQMLATIADLDRRVDLYEDAGLHALALDLIPLDRLASEARAAAEEASWGGYEDELALGLVRWFKNDFMNWVDPIMCAQCGGKTDSKGGTDPTREEREKGGAGRVELWECGNCKTVERFPRYNDLKTLMRTRRGRCGEFSNLFMLFLRAVGLRARYVWNAEDHVWNEYFSTTLNRYIHVDPSEGKTNQPLIYSVGWGKKMTYIFSFGVTGARDTTLAYHLSPALPKGRKALSERDLQRALKEVTERRRSAAGGEVDRARLRAEEREEVRREADMEGRQREEKEREEREGSSGLEGRVSGTTEWRKSRGEAGDAARPVSDAFITPSSAPIFDLSADQSSDNLLHFGSSAVATTPNDTSSSTIILTPAVPSCTGASYIPIPLPLTQSFLSTFTFRIVRPKNSDGADGLALVYALSFPQLGSGGGDLGYGGLGPGWAVEIDTYRTEDRTADPPTPHISLHAPLDPHHRNSLACTPDPRKLPPLTDVEWYELRVQWSAKEKRVGVWLAETKGVKDGGSADEYRWEWLFGADIPEERLQGGDDEAWLGLSAACGGLSEVHEIGSWKLWSLDDDK